MTNWLFEVPDDAEPPASAEFKLSITRALADQLAEALQALRPAPLDAEQLAMLKDRPGVYELYVKRERVYVGKASKSLPDRLSNHLRKLSGRQQIDLAEVCFICLYVDEDLEAAAPEKMLIKKYRDHGGSPWNTMGFGNKDPGRNRDHSLVKAKHFDAEYPIDLDRTIPELANHLRPVEDLLHDIKARLPYNLRFETKNKIKQELIDAHIAIPAGELSVRRVIGLVLNALPEGWQATALPGYVILYNESTNYRSALVYWRKVDGRVEEYVGDQRLDPRGGAVESDDD
ncbi:Eco29kI family restriction endonuclease [Nocardia pseudovaccinii]|uniref:Eco29kI family restriction endonuclease n=1 Tax=Nocardia pseudovaccinii TaxID=189540 RepID=UPI000A0156E5|nr:Eco29kI family restriction endonuclease [Nocardia pseudovaccinii]